ncbi:MAG: SUMF1/EgtB/PvdO family nonheme iron enzyme, partial [Proteobacteria bacterium]|nr:SUMF1/EgtB/PvdO family nonheme iron enzyme [Pseudomonadota bacterium]
MSTANAPATPVNTPPNPQTAAKKPRTAPANVRSGNNQTPANPPANPPDRPAQLFKPSDEPPLQDADVCSEPGDDLAPAMVVLPPGDFWMGSPDGEAGRYPDEGPSHWVTIPRPFAIGRCEVTVGQFKRFAEEKHYVTTAEQPDAKGCYTYD